MTTTLFTQINYILAPLLDQIALGQIGLLEFQDRMIETMERLQKAFTPVLQRLPD